MPPAITPTFAVVSSSIRPSRRSAIARAAAAIAERPSSGNMPACAARPWKRTSSLLLVRRAEDDLADRRRLVVDEAERAPAAAARRTRSAPRSPTSSFGVNRSSMPACGRPSCERGARPPRASPRPPPCCRRRGSSRRRCGRTPSSDDRLDAALRAGPCRGGRRGRSACRPSRSARAGTRRLPVVEPIRAPGVVLVDLEPERSRGSRARGRRPPAPRPAGSAAPPARGRGRKHVRGPAGSHRAILRERRPLSHQDPWSGRTRARSATSATARSAAPTKSRNSGAGRVGRDLNSGWNWLATNHGWSGQLHDLDQPALLERARRRSGRRRPASAGSGC